MQHFKQQIPLLNNHKNRLTNGNMKVKSYMFSLPPIKSCLNCDSCKVGCYAVKSYRQYPNVTKLWDSNFDLVENDLTTLFSHLYHQLKKISKQPKHKRVVRIHQSGDFFSYEYINVWRILAKRFDNILFYGYSKVLNHNQKFKTALNNFDSLENVNILDSTIPNTNRKNFGSVEYIQKMSKKYNLKICESEPKNNIVCGLERDNKYNKKGLKFCDYCIKNKGVLFVEH